MKFPIACHTVCWGGKKALEAVLEEVRAAGYEGVEVYEPLETLLKEDRLKRLVQKLDLKVAGIWVGDLKKRIETAGQFAVKYLSAFGEADYINEMCDYAERYGVTLVLHPHVGPEGVGTDGVGESVQEIDQYLEERPKLMLCPDTAHLALAGIDPVQFIYDYAPKIVHFHLKDWKPDFGRREGCYRGFCSLGEGTVDLAGAMTALEEIGYSGWVIWELDASETPFESARISREYLAGLGY